MKIDIKTKTPIRDNDIKAIYLIKEALRISTPRMKLANLEFSIRSHFKNNAIQILTP